MQTKTLKLVKRKIRESIREALLDQTSAGKSVFLSKSTKLDHADLPAILIYPNGERISRFNEAPKNYRRTHAIKIEIISSAATDDELDQKLEEIGEQVENIMELNEDIQTRLGKLIESLELSGTQYAFESDGQTPVGSLILDFDVVFFSDAATPCVTDDFKQATVDWKAIEQDGSGITAQDALVIPQT